MTKRPDDRSPIITVRVDLKTRKPRHCVSAIEGLSFNTTSSALGVQGCVTLAMRNLAPRAAGHNHQELKFHDSHRPLYILLSPHDSFYTCHNHFRRRHCPRRLWGYRADMVCQACFDRGVSSVGSTRQAASITTRSHIDHTPAAWLRTG